MIGVNMENINVKTLEIKPFEVFKGNIEGYDSIYDKVISLLSARRESDE